MKDDISHLPATGTGMRILLIRDKGERAVLLYDHESDELHPVCEKLFLFLQWPGREINDSKAGE